MDHRHWLLLNSPNLKWPGRFLDCRFVDKIHDLKGAETKADRLCAAVNAALAVYRRGGGGTHLPETCPLLLCNSKWAAEPQRLFAVWFLLEFPDLV